MKIFNNKNRLTAVFLLVIFSLSFLYDIAPAKAQWAISGYPALETHLGIETAKEQVKITKEKIAKKLMDASMLAVLKASEYILNKIAYDFAVSLASGNWGQSPLYQPTQWGNYLKGVSGDALGEALDAFGKGIGFNLCTLPDPKMDLALKIGLHTQYDIPRPSCTWQQLKETYNKDNIYSKYWGKDGESFAKAFNNSITIDDTDFGIAMKAKAEIDAYSAEKEAAASADRQEGGGAKSLTTAISGGIITPAKVNQAMLTDIGNQVDKVTNKANRDAVYMGAAMTNGSFQVLQNVASTFVEAFAGTAIDNFLNKGMFPFGLGKIKCVPSYLKIGGLNIDACVDTKYTADGYYDDSRVSTYRQEASMLFAELLIAKTKSFDNYDLLSKFLTCNFDATDTGENCILDKDFGALLRQIELTGEPLTLREALESPILKFNDWKLSGPNFNNSLESLGKRCFESAYCYENIKVLRKARVLPLGFEIATLQTGEAPLLSEVLDNFDNPTSSYYRLVNPNWVLKMPKARCKAVAYTGQVFDKDVNIRQEECVDLQSCVGYDSRGECNSYGYCLEEKNIWRFNANYCDEQYDTCKVLTNSKGSSVSYLTRTLNSEMCGEDNVGCRFYSNYQVFPGNNFASGTWESGKSNQYIQYGYYLDKNTETCQSASAGCNAFTLNTSTSVSPLFIKKAPDYLGCYDSDNNRGNGVQYPQNLSDLNKINPISKDECSKYAAVCLPEEEGCNIYNPLPLPVFGKTKTESVTGKFLPAIINDQNEVVAWNDQCDATCVGYNAFVEVPNRYHNGSDLVYIIPTAEAVCGKDEIGCSAFVNLNSTSGGLEQTEYYSDLRLCSLPDQTKQKNFYTYEGRDGGGYQLVGYTLLKHGEAPAQYFRDPQEAEDYGICDEARALVDSDCLIFRDDQGRTYPAFLSKTVAISDKCTPYRAVKSEFYGGNECLGSFGAGDSEKIAYYDTASGYCIYNGLPQNIVTSAGQSKVCSKEKVSCRQYKGSAGNVERELMRENFENNFTFKGGDDSKGWFYGAETVSEISQESLVNEGKSLKSTIPANSGNGISYQLDNISGGKFYNLSFLAKGRGTIKIRIAADWYFVENLTLTDNWRSYEFALDLSNWNAIGNITVLSFVPNSSSGDNRIVFLDNVIIKEIQDNVALVKDKLSVPTACDSDQTDNLPGQALGCRAYQVPNNNNIFNLHNFSYLCRDGAVGCTKLFDTNNRNISDTNSDKYIVYNLWLDKTRIKGNTTFSGVLEETVSGTGITLSCNVALDELGCYAQKTYISVGLLNIILEANTGGGRPELIYKTNATTVIPPKANSPVYLVPQNNSLNLNAFCRSDQQGCKALGISSIFAGTGTRDYQDTYLKILPENQSFEDSLCSDKTEGCDEWKSGSAKYYFKDPNIYGNLICEWKNSFVAKDGATKNTGWYYKNLGSCEGGSGTISCYKDSDCGDFGKCVVGEKPCHSVWGSIEGNKYLPSIGTAQYIGEVGECPSDQDGCSRFDDHSDVSSKKCALSGMKCEYDKDCSSDPKDLCVASAKSYYLIDDSRLTEKVGEACGGKASLNAGCVLLDKVSDPLKVFDTQATYDDSLTQGGERVVPKNNPSTNDANRLLKVTLDRECNLWAYCNNYQVEDGQARCYSFHLCEKSAPGMFSEGNCEEPVDPKSWKWINSVMKDTDYKARPVDWASPELSGYSLYNSYQIPSLGVKWVRTKPFIGTFDPGKVKEAQGDPESFSPHLVHYENSIEDENGDLECHSLDNTMTTPCGPTGRKGVCLGGDCIYPINPNSKITDTKLSCRGYPEQNSPFDPWGIISLDKTGDKTPLSVLKYEFKISNTSLNNICTVEKPGDTCDCAYLKADYGSRTMYWPLYTKYSDSIPSKICSGGVNDGENCSDKAEGYCGEGFCSDLKSKNRVMGWQGYCVETSNRFKLLGFADRSNKTNPCLTWWPVEVAPGAPDIWIINNKASYNDNESKDRYMCVANDPVKLKPLPEVDVMLKTPGTAGDEKTGFQGEETKTNIEMIKYCNFAGDGDKEDCLDLGGENGPAFNINLAKSKKIITGEIDYNKDGCICTPDLVDYKACDKDDLNEEVEKLKCTPGLYQDNLCIGDNATVKDKKTIDINEEFVCKTEKTYVFETQGSLIEDENKYAVLGVKKKIFINDPKVVWSYKLINNNLRKTFGRLESYPEETVGLIFKTGNDFFDYLWDKVIKPDWDERYWGDGCIGGNSCIRKKQHDYTSGVYILNLPSNAIAMQCYNNKDNKQFPLLAQGAKGAINNNLKGKEITRVYCPLTMNNNTVGVFQQKVSADGVNFKNNGKIKKSEVIKIDVVFGNGYCEKDKSFDGNDNDYNGCDNTIADDSKAGKFFKNNIISFENEDLTGCEMRGGADGNCNEELDDCVIDSVNNVDVCITELKKDFIPKLDEDGETKQSIQKNSYKVNGGETVWEVLVRASFNKALGNIFDNSASKLLENKKAYGFFAANGDSLSTRRDSSIPSDLNNFTTRGYDNNEGYSNDLNGLGVRIIWDNEDNLAGAQLELHDADKNVAGVNFFFVVHFADGSCSEFAKVSDDNTDLSNPSSADLVRDFKPVTWRLREGKGAQQKEELAYESAINSLVYNIPFSRFSPSSLYTTSSRGLARVYQKGLIGEELEKRDFTGWFTNGELLSPFLDTYYTTENSFSDNPDRSSIKNALINYESIKNKDFAMPSFNSKENAYKDMLQKMFVAVFATSSSKLSFRGSIDCSIPRTTGFIPLNDYCAGTKIKPPVVAAPVELRGDLCTTFKNSGGRSDCKTFVLNTPIINKQTCGLALINGQPCEVSPNSDVALEFYIWADPAQMPLRRIAYSKGDTGASPIQISARSIGNRKPLCSSYGYCGAGVNWTTSEAEKYKYQIPCGGNSDCRFYDVNNRNPDGSGKLALISAKCIPFDSKADTPNGFGNTDETGCKNNPLEFHFSYSTAGEKTPKVQVLDNWGWCSGRCTTAPYGARTYGCYNDGNLEDCDLPKNNINPWIQYNGSVIVK